MSERRGDNRWNLLLLIPVLNTDNNEVLGYIADLNENGILLFSKHNIELDKKFSLSIRFQDLKEAFVVKNITADIQFEAQSRWFDRNVNQAFHRTGFRLTNLSSKAHNAISQLVCNVAGGN
jgi:hypothetical protein